ncbi:MAG: oxidoreductase, partial [Ktedonobacteraceae bacterium]|nr:oxidoreductase [Ktedonobacteraceae bacterium]
MERRTVPGRLSWQLGEVVAMQEETARAKSITLAVPHWNGHRPGQHVDVRLTAEDGYQAERSYSIASAPKPDQRVTLTVERIDDGEVSPYLTGELRVEEQMGGPLLLVAGGSGIVPLMAMIRSWAALGSTIPIRLLYSSRSYPEVIYRDELARLVKSNSRIEVVHTLTREQPLG